jgi:hypothetical protein
MNVGVDKPREQERVGRSIGRFNGCDLAVSDSDCRWKDAAALDIYNFANDGLRACTHGHSPVG